MKDEINSPAHYASQSVDGIEPIELLENYSGNIFNLLKYIIRAGHKEGNSTEKDLSKALWYCRRAIKNCEDWGKFVYLPTCVHLGELEPREERMLEHLRKNNPLLKNLFNSYGGITIVQLCELKTTLTDKLEKE